VARKVISPATPAGTVLAFDFGTRRIGVAIGETSTGIAHPLTTLADADGHRRLAAIGALIEAWRPVLLVVGLPTHADGTAHPMTARARRFARQLEGRFGLPVAFGDERFTTRTATANLLAVGGRGGDRKSVRDQVAAQLILQAYLDQRDPP
jgi:putative Holliday junction resolvase